MPVYKRGALVGLQNTLIATGGAAAATLHPLNYVEDLQITRTINKDDPKYLRYIEWLLLRRVPLDRIAGFKINFDFDFTETGWFLYNLYGTPTHSGSTHLFSDRNGATRKALTLAMVTEHATEWDRIADAWLTELKFSGDPRGRVKVEGSGIGWMEPPLTSGKPTWTPTTPPDRSPVSGWQNVISIDDTANCVESWSLTLRNAVTPRFCSPPELPDETTPEGATPGDWEFAGLSAMMDGALAYNGYAGSPLEALITGLSNAITWEATDAKTTGLGYVPGALITAYAVDWDKSDKKYPKSPLSLDVAGALTDSPADGAALTIALTNGLASYAAS